MGMAKFYTAAPHNSTRNLPFSRQGDCRLSCFSEIIPPGRKLMTKNGILNPDLLAAIASCGHTDTFVIADSGLPIPDGPAVIDLSLVRGVPRFVQVLEAVLGQLVVEGFVVADEMARANTEVASRTQALTSGLRGASVPHEDLKRMVAKARFVVRTGEVSPYANIILRCGVNF